MRGGTYLQSHKILWEILDCLVRQPVVPPLRVHLDFPKEAGDLEAGETDARRRCPKSNTYQHPPTGHELRPVRAKQPSRGDLLEGADRVWFSHSESERRKPSLSAESHRTPSVTSMLFVKNKERHGVLPPATGNHIQN